jgi:hypothetical protein
MIKQELEIMTDHFLCGGRPVSVQDEPVGLISFFHFRGSCLQRWLPTHLCCDPAGQMHSVLIIAVAFCALANAQFVADFGSRGGKPTPAVCCDEDSLISVSGESEQVPTPNCLIVSCSQTPTLQSLWSQTVQNKITKISVSVRVSDRYERPPLLCCG